MPTNETGPFSPEGNNPHPQSHRNSENPGYEVKDVNVGGVVTFIAGLSGFLLIFFVFCFFMGKAINYALARHDGEANRWHLAQSEPGSTPRGQKREDLTSNAVMEQRQFQSMTQSFPTPRLETDDGNQDTADLHAREDLLLNNYSTSSDLGGGAIRIPIEQAMQLVVQRGLPKPATAATPAPLMAGEAAPAVAAPLTDGFARTGYEQDTIQARDQKLEFQRAEGKQ